MLDYPPDESDPARPLSPLGWRDRLAEVRARWTAGQLVAGALLCAGVAVASFALLRPPDPRPPTELSLPSATTAPASTGASTSTPGTTPAVLVVHAAGAVVAPGLYRVPAGSRVADVVAAAGGFTADAERDRVNLAALVHDGERVAVPRTGEPMPDVTAAGETNSELSGPLDLNAATVAQLDALPGVGPATAKAIVDDRERNGPFKSVDDLLRVRGIGPAKLDQLRPLVTV